MGEQDREDAIEARRMAMAMVKKNKAKKAERKKEEALRKTKAKIEQQSAVLDAKMKIAEKEALQKAAKNEERRKKDRETADKEKLEMENEVSKMDKALDDIETGAKETKKRLAEEQYFKITKNNTVITENDGDSNSDKRIIMKTDIRVGKEIDEIKVFDDSIKLYFDDDINAKDFVSGVENAEAKRLEIDGNLAESKERNANSASTSIELSSKKKHKKKSKKIERKDDGDKTSTKDKKKTKKKKPTIDGKEKKVKKKKKLKE